MNKALRCYVPFVRTLATCGHPAHPGSTVLIRKRAIQEIKRFEEADESERYTNDVYMLVFRKLIVFSSWLQETMDRNSKLKFLGVIHRFSEGVLDHFFCAWDVIENHPNADGRISWCADCLSEMAIPCACCGRVIFPGSEVLLYDAKDIPHPHEGATRITSGRIKDEYVGCTYVQCAQSGKLPSAVWTAGLKGGVLKRKFSIFTNVDAESSRTYRL